MQTASATPTQTLGHLPGPFLRILGHEPVGEIIAAAPDVTTRKVGDRVGTAWTQSTCGRCEWCQQGRRMFCPCLNVALIGKPKTRTPYSGRRVVRLCAQAETTLNEGKLCCRERRERRPPDTAKLGAFVHVDSDSSMAHRNMAKCTMHRPLVVEAVLVVSWLSRQLIRSFRKK